MSHLSALESVMHLSSYCSCHTILISLRRRWGTVAHGSWAASPGLRRKPLALQHEHGQSRAQPVPQALGRPLLILPHQGILDSASNN